LARPLAAHVYRKELGREGKMYVVRIARPKGEPDYKAFSSLSDAKHQFYAADDRIPGDFAGAPSSNVRSAARNVAAR
jgi:hypothetical protein